MFNRIRRAALWTRQRLVSASAHHDPTPSTRRSAAKPTPSLTPSPQQFVRHPEFTRADHVGLVRPYVLTSRERARLWGEPRHRTLLICPHLDIAVAV
ncbi:hypothetical protein ACFYTG_30350 [Streptomyces mirabilis]|uniref:hypothetical protein n=1 Tax=Streptomyces mirabilis TaxID=68239 RepID=UPI0036985547